MNTASRQPATAQVTKVSTASVTDQGSQLSSSRTAVIGTSTAAEKARKAGPAVSTHQSMSTLSHGVIGTTHSAGYSTSQAAMPRIASNASVATIRTAQSQSTGRLRSSPRKSGRL